MTTKKASTSTFELTDDDIEIVAHNHPNKLYCQVCQQDLTPLTIPQREYHYEEHFSDEPRESAVTGGVSDIRKSPASNSIKPVSSSSAKSPSKSKSKSKPPSKIFRRTTHEEQNIFWHASQRGEPPSNFSPGLIPVLKKALIRSHEKGATQRAWLCIEAAVHIKGDFWDARWGCGYRNYLMACAALMEQQQQPMYFPLLDSPVPPGIRNLQILLERAWRDDYDAEGAAQLGRKLVDTEKWIGTADLYVAFTYRGIPSQLVDFELKRGADPLLQWIYNYFSGGDPQPKNTTVGEALRGARPVVVTDKLPLILQRQGHSITIVGCEQGKGGSLSLLVFDPSKRIPDKMKEAGLKYHNPARPDNSASRSKPAKMLHQVIHPVETARSLKRRSPEAEAGPSKKKRINAATSDDKVIVISDDEDSANDVRQRAGTSHQKVDTDTLNPSDVLKAFRLDAKTLNRWEKLQILYFPLEEPLDEAEKNRRRVVTSDKIS